VRPVMIWLLYNVVFGFCFVLMLPYFLFRMWRRGGYRRDFLQRLGLYRPEVRAALAQRPRVWVHAVSVGEVYVALRVVAELRARRADLAFTLTTTTSTGHSVAAARLHRDDVLLYFPVDFPGVVRRALKAVRPVAIVLTECELWPNLIRLARAAGVPVVLVNGRLSESSYNGYRKVRPFLSRALGHMDLLLVQEQIYAERFLSLGAAPARLKVMGTAKYDVAEYDPAGEAKAQQVLESAGIGPDDLLLVGGSTWPGEEAVLMQVYRALKPAFASLRLALVPRHAERADAIARDIERRHFRAVRRRELDARSTRPREAPDVLLVDTTGELRNFYGRAAVIFVGKSLTHHGGQNVVEPALCGKPVIVGPYTENFASVVQDFLQADALFQVPDAETLERTIRMLLENPAQRLSVGERARQVVTDKRGAVRASVDLIEGLLM
ncbi:MAG: glycosyltransferase, partial [Kiritimatiellae bacterium]|nr:glycosyltransferase [Kiritimatiellia bacterium]